MYTNMYYIKIYLNIDRTDYVFSTENKWNICTYGIKRKPLPKIV